MSGNDFAHLPGIGASEGFANTKGRGGMRSREARQGTSARAVVALVVQRLGLIHSWLFEFGNFWHGWP